MTEPLRQVKRVANVYKAISDSLENGKIMNCMLSVKQNYIICII